MTQTYTIPLADPKATLETVGGKGSSLARLYNAGLPVPDGFHITTAAYNHFIHSNNLGSAIESALDQVDNTKPVSLEAASQRIISAILLADIPQEITSAIVQAYTTIPGNNPCVAVRSSATAEDLPEASFAGQQDSFLNISGPDNLLEAIKKCWASLWTARAISYRFQQGITTEGVALAIVVQVLVPAEVAGILFTANSITGKREQAVINAAWGLGEAIVGGKVTPDTIIMDKETGRVLDYQIADKQLMTVRVNGATAEQPVPESLRQAAALGEQQARKLTEMGTRIETLYGMPMDIEWTLTDGELAIVQARPITALPEADTTLAKDWTMPDPKGQYMRASIVDLMPDPLTPLFSTLGLSAINRGICELSEVFLNMPEGTDLNVMLTINGYAYQQANYSPQLWWLIITRMVPAFPRLMREGLPYWQEEAHPQYVEVTESWRNKDLSALSPAELMDGCKEVLAAFADHLGALMGSTMGPTSGSEGLFTNVYEKLIRKEGDPSAPTFLMGFDNKPLQSEKALFDLAQWCQNNEPLVAYLAETPAEQLVDELSAEITPQNVDQSAWIEWKQRFREYLDLYGYSIYDMDFAKPLPMEEPEPLLEMLKLFISGEAKNPYERQQEFTSRREDAEKSIRDRLKGIRRWGFEKSLGLAQSRAPLREDGIAEIGFCYPVLHQLFAELGQRFVNAAAIEQPRDIYWLEQTEVETLITALENGQTLEDMSAAVRERQTLWQARKRVTPPPQLPPGKKFLGFDMEAILAGSEGLLEGNIIKGVPASPGKITGKACVLHGPEDFDQMNRGDILIASITTPAWTPLFAMASGVVTDIGGPLSHGSIVAREYGIPAVLGTGIATSAISSGQSVTVDGTEGTVTLHTND
ncbi:MAG: hypothetical protein JSV42_14345 [Chloroflexota bacterium]|nr:MAG: hypothetical protein JSV42_14345 [Chloroflexota bacterium]